MSWFKRGRASVPPRRYVQQGMLRQHELMHDLARVGPAALADVTVTAPHNLSALVRRECVDGVWTCDDLTTVVPGLPVKRQFPTRASLLEALFQDVAEREFYHVKRDGAPAVVAVILESTFEAMARNIRFRYLVHHGQDSNTVIIAVRL